MKPDLELVQIQQGESFKAWSHGYPFHTVRWHFHPEYELHLIVETDGHYFVGDFIGEFEPHNLVLTGPNLPHNWLSHVPEGQAVAQRCLILQFSESFIQGAMHILPELAALQTILEQSKRGLLFDKKTAQLLNPLMQELMHAQGLRRLELFMSIMRCLCECKHSKTLTSLDYLPDPSGYMSAGVNKALSYIREHLDRPFSESDLAKLAGQSTAAFSRSFRTHTGMTLVQYVRRLRINLACQLLMSDAHKNITDISFLVGFNNLSNFNRQFLLEKGMPPSHFRKLIMETIDVAA